MSGPDPTMKPSGAPLPPAPDDAQGSDTPAGAPRPNPDNRWVAALFEEHNRDLLRFLTCRLGSIHEAKEVAQQAYVRLLQLDQPDSVSYLRAYLFKTAANLAADRLKSAARRDRIDRLDFFDDAEDLAPSPEGRVSAEQELEVILAAVDELPPRCRYAFILHRFHDHTIAEVAAAMNTPVRTVQWYVAQALVLCRERLYGQEDSHDSR